MSEPKTPYQIHITDQASASLKSTYDNFTEIYDEMLKEYGNNRDALFKSIQFLYDSAIVAIAGGADPTLPLINAIGVAVYAVHKGKTQ